MSVRKSIPPTHYRLRSNLSPLSPRYAHRSFFIQFTIFERSCACCEFYLDGRRTRVGKQARADSWNPHHYFYSFSLVPPSRACVFVRPVHLPLYLSSPHRHFSTTLTNKCLQSQITDPIVERGKLYMAGYFLHPSLLMMTIA